MSLSPCSRIDSATLTIVGLSGGVDSSVAAWLLHKQGLKIEGIYMQNWSEPGTRGCDPSAMDTQDAYSVAASLGIPVRIVDLSRDYKEWVFLPCMQDFRRGLTPNPDVLCNRHIKFRAFLDLALAQGADGIATGHYARTRRRDGRLELLMGLDKHKDQSYFLYRLDQEQLSRVCFPLGELHKGEVRELAARAGLVTCDKPDSTGICFIGEQNFRAFLGRYLPVCRGELVDSEGHVLGEHDGIWFYTIGQRHGIGIGGYRGGNGKPWYVAIKDSTLNRLTVVQGAHHPLLYANEAEGEDCHWIAGKPPQVPLQCKVRLRHGQHEQDCILIKIEANHCRVKFATPQRAVTPGQSLVFYQAEVCLGGALVVSSH